MTRVAHTKTALARNVVGVNLTDTSYEAMSAGSNNGVTFAYLETDLILLKNTLGGNAVYTFVLTTPAAYTQFGGTLTSGTITVANGVTQIVRVNEVLKGATGLIAVDCDVAGSIRVLDNSN